MRPIASVLFAATIVASGLASSAHAQSTGLEDMVGARADQAEGELQRRGYRNIRGEKGDDRSYTYWWNGDRRQCVTIATMNGRYDSITPTLPADCRQPMSARRPRYPQYTPEPPRYGMAAGTGDLSRQCRNEAAAAFDRRPSEVTANAPIQQRDGYIVQGWFDGSRGTKFFNCRFDMGGRFLGVN